jgi:tyramine---L-glutamate ligase
LRLFVSEFICGGGWSGGERPASMVREGAAMWRALLADLLRIPALRVVTTWDRRLPASLDVTAEALEVIPVSGPEEEIAVFARLCHETDATYVIAPELDDELSRRVTIACCSAKERSFAEQMTTLRSLNCSVEAIDLCGDKWALYEHFKRYGRPTIPTIRVGHECDSLPWPRVLKLRMGAGSQAMQRVASPSEWDEYDAGSRCTEAIAQPWIRGRSLSVGAIFDRAGAVHVLPVADQWIDPEQGFAYLGGRIPSTVEAGSLDSLIQDTLSTIPGWSGYVGVDVLIPESSPEIPLIVEINPRLTTSYVGYQKLCLDNLAALWIGDETSPRPLRWRPECVEFNAAGEFR